MEIWYKGTNDAETIIPNSNMNYLLMAYYIIYTELKLSPNGTLTEYNKDERNISVIIGETQLQNFT